MSGWELPPEPLPQPQPVPRPAAAPAHRVFSCAAREWPARAAGLGAEGAAVLDVRQPLKHANPHHDPAVQPLTGLDPGLIT
jgi:hypothetical protein